VIQKTLNSMRHLDPEQRAWAEGTLVLQAAEDDPVRSPGSHPDPDIVDPDGPPPSDEDPSLPERELRRHIRRDGQMEFKGRLDPETSARSRRCSTLSPDNEVPDTRGYAERAGDAFADVLNKHPTAADLPTHNGLRTEVRFTISLDALERATTTPSCPATPATSPHAKPVGSRAIAIRSPPS